MGSQFIKYKVIGLLHWTTKFTILSSVTAAEPLEIIIIIFFYDEKRCKKGSWHGILGNMTNLVMRHAILCYYKLFNIAL